MAVIKGFFFDLDGTLVDTYEADFMAYRDAIKEITGKTVSREDFYKTNGYEMREKLKMLGFTKLGEDDILRIAAGKKAHYRKYLHLTRPNKSLFDFLESNARDHTVVLVTTAKEQNARLVLEAHGIIQHFTHLVFGDQVVRPKPHPEAYLKALTETGLKPEEVVAFEDSESGIESAAAAGISVIRIRDFA